MTKSSIDILSDVIIYLKYSRYLRDKKRRETWNEICYRNRDMHIKKFPHLAEEITEIYREFVIPKKVLPSMRTLQFAGKPIEINPARQYNCSALAITCAEAFAETMFLLLSGCGVGFSVQKNHVKQLPKIQGVIKPTGKQHPKRFLVADSIEGWADAIKILVNSYFKGQRQVEFDYSDIRAKGMPLITAGGKAPGAGPLRNCIAQITSIFENALETRGRGTQLKPIECHDICCFIADSVLTAGIRRSATISLFSKDDQEMLYCKSGNWWELNPQRARANNSAVFIKGIIKKKDFKEFWKIVQNSGSGEPGIFFTNDPNVLVNPCVIGETELLTKNGYQRIDSLIHQEVEIWNGIEWSLVTPKITGENQHCLKINLSDGRSITCTDYHTFKLADGYTGKVIDKEAINLKIGDKLAKYSYPILEQKDITSLNSDNFYTQGFYSGDGNENSDIIWLYEPKYNLQQFLKCREIGIETTNQFGTKRKTLKTNFVPLDKFYIPSNLNIENKLSWLSGLFDADATELIEGGLQITSVNMNFLANLQKLLSTLGANSKIVSGLEAGYRNLPNGRGGYSEYWCQENKRLCISAQSIQDLVNLGLRCNRLKFNKTPNRDASRFVEVTSIEDAGIIDIVYCANELKNHTICFNGITTGNCGEISLVNMEFCNLCEINAGNITSQEDLNVRARAATIIGTLQASYTDFHYLRDDWRENCEKEALLGVSMTGIASNSTKDLDLTEAAEIVQSVNKEWAKKIGINPFKRGTTGKPAGTSSCVLGTSSGVHAWHSKYFWRRIRVNKDEPIYGYILKTNPHLVEDEIFSPHTTAVISFPMKAPEGAITRESEGPIDLLNRVKHIHKNWILPGHNDGVNTHNQSVTVYIKDDEWDAVGEWMWENRDVYHGISVLPYDGGTYKQAPFEDITEETYLAAIKKMKPIDLTQIIEEDDQTDLVGELACSGGACEIR